MATLPAASGLDELGADRTVRNDSRGARIPGYGGFAILRRVRTPRRNGMEGMMRANESCYRDHQVELYSPLRTVDRVACVLRD